MKSACKFLLVARPFSTFQYNINDSYIIETYTYFRVYVSFKVDMNPCIFYGNGCMVLPALVIGSCEKNGKYVAYGRFKDIL